MKANLQELKNRIAMKHGYDSWRSAFQKCNKEGLEHLLNEVFEEHERILTRTNKFLWFTLETDDIGWELSVKGRSIIAWNKKLSLFGKPLKIKRQ